MDLYIWPEQQHCSLVAEMVEHVEQYIHILNQALASIESGDFIATVEYLKHTLRFRQVYWNERGDFARLLNNIDDVKTITEIWISLREITRQPDGMAKQTQTEITQKLSDLIEQIQQNIINHKRTQENKRHASLQALERVEQRREAARQIKPGDWVQRHAAAMQPVMKGREPAYQRKPAYWVADTQRALERVEQRREAARQIKPADCAQ
eukprot:2802983-Rhodomonas_salina.1